MTMLYVLILTHLFLNLALNFLFGSLLKLFFSVFVYKLRLVKFVVQYDSIVNYGIDSSIITSVIVQSNESNE